MNAHRFRLLTVSALAALFLGCDDSSGPAARDAALILAVAGDAQSGQSGAELPTPLVVVIFDLSNQPLPGVTVSFTVEAGSGTVTPRDVVTGANGAAQTRWTIGVGEQRVSASAERRRGDPLRAVFSATVIDDPRGAVRRR